MAEDKTECSLPQSAGGASRSPYHGGCNASASAPAQLVALDGGGGASVAEGQDFADLLSDPCGIEGTCSIDALLLGLMARINTDVPGLLLHKKAGRQAAASGGCTKSGLQKSDSLSQLSGFGSSLLGGGAGGCGVEEKQLSFAYSVGMVGSTGLSASSNGGGQTNGNSANHSATNDSCTSSGQRRVVIVGVEGRSLSDDARLLRWTRRQVIRPDDIVVLVSCWELASDARFLRLPGMILVSTSGACEYNRGQQRAVTQRLRTLAQQNLSGFKVYPLALPVVYDDEAMTIVEEADLQALATGDFLAFSEKAPSSLTNCGVRFLLCCTDSTADAANPSSLKLEGNASKTAEAAMQRGVSVCLPLLLGVLFLSFLF